HVGRAGRRAGGVLRGPGEVEARDGETRVVAAVEVQRGVVLDDPHAEDRVLDPAHRAERRPGRVARRGQQHLLPVARRPVEVAGEIEVAVVVREPDPCAHGAAPVVVGPARAASRPGTPSCPPSHGASVRAPGPLPAPAGQGWRYTETWASIARSARPGSPERSASSSSRCCSTTACGSSWCGASRTKYARTRGWMSRQICSDCVWLAAAITASWNS